jgi:hypothetical protein
VSGVRNTFGGEKPLGVRLNQLAEQIVCDMLRRQGPILRPALLARVPSPYGIVAASFGALADSFVNGDLLRGCDTF